MRKLVLVTVPIALAACGKKSDAPAKPINGAPVAFVAGRLTPGEPFKGSVAVEEYNFSDKRVAGYDVMIRYKDASGAVLKVRAGTPFEKDVDGTSYTGRPYACDPQSWCKYTIDHLNVPEKAATAEVLATRVRSLADDIHFDDKPLFDSKDDHWPDTKQAANAPSGS